MWMLSSSHKSSDSFGFLLIPSQVVPMWMLSSSHKSMQRLLVAAADSRAQVRSPTDLPTISKRPPTISHDLRSLIAAADSRAQAKAAREFYRRVSHEEAPSIPLTPGGFVAPPPLPSLRSKSAASSKSSSSKSAPLHSPTSF